MMTELLTDPMPHLNRDSHLWNELFSNIYKLDLEWSRKTELHKLLWRTRQMGTEIVRTHIDTKLVPIYAPVGYWEDEDMYEVMKKYLKPYVREIKQLLAAV